MNENLDAMVNSADSSDIEIDIGRIFGSIWHYAWLILLLAAIGAGALFAYSKANYVPMYQSTANVLIFTKMDVTKDDKNDVNGSEDDDSTGRYLTTNTTQLINIYNGILTSSSTLNKVVENLGFADKYSVDILRYMVAIETENFPVCQIIVTCDNSEDAANIANELAAILYDQVNGIVGGSYYAVLEEAKPSLELYSSNTVKKTILGGLIGAFLAIGIIVIIELTNNKIYNDEYLMQTYNISVLAGISDSGEIKLKGRGRRGKYRYYKYGAQSGGDAK